MDIIDPLTFKLAIEHLSRSLGPRNGCGHENSTESVEDGLVFLVCPDCNMCYIINEQQAEAYRRMA